MKQPPFCGLVSFSIYWLKQLFKSKLCRTLQKSIQKRTKISSQYIRFYHLIFHIQICIIQFIEYFLSFLITMPLEEVFEGSICGYDVKVILNSEGLIFLLWNPHRRRYYQTRLPYELTGKSQQLQNQFFLYLCHFSEDKQRISINDTGTIKVAYIQQKSKKKIPPVVYIQTEILRTGTQMKNEIKLSKQVKDIKRENLLLQNKIAQLTKYHEENLIQMKKLRALAQRKIDYSSASQSQDSPEEREKHHKKKKKKFSVISGSKNGIAQLNSAIKELSKDIEEMKGAIDKPLRNPTKNSNIQNINPALVREEEYLTEQQIYGKKMNITVDFNNKFLKDEFKIQGNLITKIKGYGRYQLISKEVIPPFGKHYFVMFIQKISFKLFSLGIVSQKRRNYQNSHMSPDLISYFAKTGAIWQKADCRCAGPQIPNGVEIRIVVDMNRFTIKWYMDRKEIGATVIGEHLRRERLVAFLEFNYEGDKVYWNEKTTVSLSE